MCQTSFGWGYSLTSIRLLAVLNPPLPPNDYLFDGFPRLTTCRRVECCVGITISPVLRLSIELLFRRKQTSGNSKRVKFKLWGKIELDENEKEILNRYRFDQAILIEAEEPDLFVDSGISAGVVALSSMVSWYWIGAASFGVAALVWLVAWYWIYHQNRQTIYVSDLLHGRHFNCTSVIELARKEAWLNTVVGFLRQVMESAKHWDGTERLTVEPLPPEVAKKFIVKGI